MPRGKVDYQKGLIYTIKSGDSLYVGSTTDFRRRKYQHKCSLKTNNTFLLYECIRKNNFEWDMKPYKIFPCNSKMELEIEEERIRCELNTDLNSKRCNVNEKEKIILKKKWQKEWREKNPEKVKNYGKNRERVIDKEYHKSYYQQNKEKIKQASEERYHKNKDEINQKSKERYQQNKEKMKQESN